MRVGVLAIGLVLGGCLAEPGRPSGGGSASNCEPQTVVDDFELGAACTPWGHAVGSVTIELGNGALQLGTSVGRAGDGGCISDTEVALGTAGVFVEVRHVLTAANSFTFLQGETTGGSQIGVVGGTELELSERFGQERVFASMPYDPIAMRWWRLRASESDETIGEYSADGRVWTMLGGTGFVEPNVLFAITAGTNGDATIAEVAEFESVNLCP